MRKSARVLIWLALNVVIILAVAVSNSFCSFCHRAHGVLCLAHACLLPSS
jgi:hypothetical protein